MSKFFMAETKLAKQEVMMMQKPKFDKKQKKKTSIDEKEEYKKCIYCIEYKKEKCSLTACPYLLDRAKFGQVEYKHFVKDSFAEYKDPPFKKRLNNQTKAFSGDLFSSPEHKARFYKVFDDKLIYIHETRASYSAVLFLLTANNALWTMVKNEVYASSFDFKQMDIVDISTDGYALYQVAKKINVEKSYTNIEEFGDEKLIVGNTFKAIVNAILIAKHGLDFLSLEK